MSIAHSHTLLIHWMTFRLHQHLAYTLWQNKQYPEARQHFLQSQDGEVKSEKFIEIIDRNITFLLGLWLHAGGVPLDPWVQLGARPFHRTDCSSISLP